MKKFIIMMLCLATVGLTACSTEQSKENEVVTTTIVTDGITNIEVDEPAVTEAETVVNSESVEAETVVNSESVETSEIKSYSVDEIIETVKSEFQANNEAAVGTEKWNAYINGSPDLSMDDFYDIQSKTSLIYGCATATINDAEYVLIATQGDYAPQGVVMSSDVLIYALADGECITTIKTSLKYDENYDVDLKSTLDGICVYEASDDGDLGIIGKYENATGVDAMFCEVSAYLFADNTTSYYTVDASSEDVSKDSKPINYTIVDC